jgi:FkbM family methyltransferase
MRDYLKSIVARLPKRWQQELKRFYFGSQRRRNRFCIDEPEYLYLGELVKPGDWALDVGANIGLYTTRLAELVGSDGRVIALEPVPETFELLAANVSKLGTGNVTLINAAASDSVTEMGMEIPRLPTGLDNYYMAKLSPEKCDLKVLCIKIDSLSICQRICLVKIDAEGHDLAALRGMKELLQRDQPVLIVEDTAETIAEFLAELGYARYRLPNYRNLIYSTTPIEA